MVKNTENLSSEIRLLPIYVVLTRNSFNLYTTNDPSSMFFTIKLKQIELISQQEKLKDLHCFDILADITTTELNKLLANGISLCAKDELDMQDWISAISDIKECQIDIKKVDKKDQVLNGLNTLDELLKKKIIPPVSQKRKLRDLHYDIIKKPLNPNLIHQDQALHKTLTKIMTSVQLAETAKTQLKRRMSNKLKAAREFSSLVHKKEQQIEEVMGKQIQLEKVEEEKQANNKSKKLERDLLQAVEGRFIQIVKEEIKEIKKSSKNEIIQEQNKANNDAKNMMKLIMEQQKLSPYGECMKDDLLNFKNKEYSHNTCLNMYGEDVIYCI